MIRTKLGLLGLCTVVLGATAIPVGSAHAAFAWLVLDAAGTVNTEVTESGGVVNLLAEVRSQVDIPDLTLLTKILKLMISVTCTNVELVNVNLEGAGTLSLGKVQFTGCAVYTGAALATKLPCTVKTAGTATGTIESVNVTSKQILHTFSDQIGEVKIPLGKEVAIMVTPDGGGTFATLFLEGAECSLPAENPVTGTVFLKDFSSFTTFAVSHLVTQNALTSLTVGSDTAEHLETSLIGSALISLRGAHFNLKWAAMDTP